MNIYVGNLDEKINDKALQTLFESFGEVKSAKIIIDRSTGQSKGYGFVEMKKKNDSIQAIEKLNGIEFFGNRMIVYKAKEGNGGKSNSIVKGKVKWM
ncbi:RNA recognition motif domain-containing protein [Roseivirga sp. BDSF3-8]|uniref:RNA recognition motif domain-containing protein n=1 Tax=Roseivirga sp. BDSF3-8 TaxID=3241598 RepID=UPI003531DAA8